MEKIDLQKEINFIHSEKANTSDKNGFGFQLLNAAQAVISDYTLSKTIKLKSFHKMIYFKTKNFYLKNFK